MNYFTRIFAPVLSATLQILLLGLGLFWVLDSGAQAMNYQWQWDRVPDFIFFYEDAEWFPAELIEGLLVTLKISAISAIATLTIALITALLRLSNSIVGKTISTLYIELIRNTPLLVQIYLLYFVFGPFF